MTYLDDRVSAMDTYRVIPGFFDIVRSENRGVAFGIFNDSTSEWRTTLLIVLSLAAGAMGSRAIREEIRHGRKPALQAAGGIVDVNS